LVEDESRLCDSQQPRWPGWDGHADALDGFPAESLFSDYRATCEADFALRIRCEPFARHVLNQWIALLERDIESLPTLSVQILDAARQRMHSTRAALIDVRRRLDHADCLRHSQPACTARVQAGCHRHAELRT